MRVRNTYFFLAGKYSLINSLPREFEESGQELRMEFAGEIAKRPPG
jgi:hypothetical protein